MDNKKIETILNDLYALDPELKKHEREIIKIIEEYAKAKPDSKFDKKFVLALREKILERAEELKTAKPQKINFNNSITWFFRFSYATIGVAVLLLLLVSLPTIYNKKKISSISTLNLSAGIAKVADSAFGKLAVSTKQTNEESYAALGAGSGAVAPTISSDQASQAEADSSSVASSMVGVGAAVKRISMPSPIDLERINYKYVYKGEDFRVDQDKMPVYKKAVSSIASQEFGRYFTEFKIDALNLNKFNGADLNNLTMSENREFGYILSVNFQEGTIDVSSNWQQWPHPENKCRDEKCYAQYRLTMNDVPDDEKVISVADQFIKDYGIESSHYGQPYVQKNWARFYGVAVDQENVYVPEEITVIYPLVLEGKTLHDESGYPNGLYVTVNIRYDRVSGARPITPYNYISSDYEVVTDKEKIMEYADRGGIYPTYKHPDPTKTIEVELDTPAEGLVRYWNYNQETGRGEELYVPALIFPVVKTADEAKSYYNDYIVVPLAKEIIEKQGDDVIGVPVPLLERGQSGASGASTGAAGEVK